MPLPNPGMDFTPFDTLPAASLDDLVENIEALADGTAISDLSYSVTAISNPYKFSVYRNGAHVSANSHTKIDFDTTLLDTNSNVTTNDRYVAPVSGFYFFSAQCGNSAATGTIMQTSLYKNGSVAIRGNAATPDTGANLFNVSGIIQLNATQYVEAFFIGGAGSTAYTGQELCYFQGFFISST